MSASLEAAIAAVDTNLIPPSVAPGAGAHPLPVPNTFSATFLPVGTRLRRGTKLTRGPYADLLEKVAQFGPQGKFMVILTETGAAGLIFFLAFFSIIKLF